MQPDRPVQTTLAFHASRIVIDAGVLMAMAAMSMTFVSAPGGSRSALAADAFPAVILLLPIFAVTLIPDHTRPLHPVLGWVSMVLALAALPYAFVKLLDARVLADTLGGSVGFGPILLLLGCVVTLGGIGIGIVRDLLGQPSGGTPQRSAAYATKRSTRTRHDGGRAATPSGPSAPPETGPPTRVIQEPDSDEAATRVLRATPPPVAERARPSAPAQPATTTPRQAAPSEPQATPRPMPTVTPRPATPPPADDEVEPITAQPEIVFPDTGAVAREAEPDVEDEADHDVMSTAERADAALTDHLLTMFDDDDFDEDER